MKTNAKTVEEYLNSFSEEKKEVLSKVRKVILKNLPKGYEETFNWGMIAYEIPLSKYPKTYNGKPLMFAALAAQKNYFSLYLMCMYGSEELKTWFKNKWKVSGKKIDLGKSCIRFKNPDDIPLDVIGELIKKVSVATYIENYEKVKGK